MNSLQLCHTYFCSMWLTTNLKLRLGYWNCRGRAQTVRYMLEEIAFAHKNVDYKEQLEILEKGPDAWLPRKADENIAGPFHNLPVLHWNDRHVFGQTMTIGQFLARKFQLYGVSNSTADDEDILRGYIDGVVSCAYTDIITNIPTCIWHMADFVDETKPINRMTRKIPSDLKALNGVLLKSSTPFYYDQVEPTIADYFVFEAYTLAKDYHMKLLPEEKDRQALMTLETVMRQRPALASYFNRGMLFKRFSAFPNESEYMARLAETLK